MAKYSVTSESGGQAYTMTTTYKTLLSLTAATGATTLRRGWIYDVLMGTDGTPADNYVTWKADRQTSATTATAITPAPLEGADAAALLVAGAVYTIEPNVTGNTMLLTIPMNQRASYRWVAAPGGEIVVPATNVAGIGLRAKSAAYTGSAQATMHFWE